MNNVPFIIKDCDKTRKVLNAVPSKEVIQRGKQIAAKFAEVKPKKILRSC